MKVLLIVEYVSSLPWSPSRIVYPVARGLCERGHEVTVACDGVDDESRLAPARVLRRGRPRRAETRRPLAFARWARRLARRGEHDVTCSFSPGVNADVWTPIDMSVKHDVRRLVGSRSIASLAMGLAHATWMPGAIVSEFAASRGAPPVSPGRVSMAQPPGDDAPALRACARQRLQIHSARPVFIMHASESSDIAPVLRALCMLGKRAQGASPVALILGRAVYPLHVRACKARCTHMVRFLGATARIDAAIACADVALAPKTIHAGPACFIADCLACSVPIVADRRAPGADLMRPDAGWIVDPASAEGWLGAMAQAVEPDRLARAREATGQAAEACSMHALLDRLESLLGAAVRQRR